MLSTRERIITSELLAENVKTALENAQQEPVVVTDKGKPAAYLISVDMFDALLAQIEAIETQTIISHIETGKIQFNEGAYKTLSEARAIAEAVWSNNA